GRSGDRADRPRRRDRRRRGREGRAFRAGARDEAGAGIHRGVFRAAREDDGPCRRDHLRLVRHGDREEGSTRGGRDPGRDDSDRGRPARRRSIRRAQVRRLVSVAWAVLALTVSAPARAAENADWLSYGHDNQLTNSVSSLALTQKSAPRLHREWLTKLDGAVYASPLSADV